MQYLGAQHLVETPATSENFWGAWSREALGIFRKECTRLLPDVGTISPEIPRPSGCLGLQVRVMEATRVVHIDKRVLISMMETRTLPGLATMLFGNEKRTLDAC